MLAAMLWLASRQHLYGATLMGSLLALALIVAAPGNAARAAQLLPRLPFDEAIVWTTIESAQFAIRYGWLFVASMGIGVFTGGIRLPRLWLALLVTTAGIWLALFPMVLSRAPSGRAFTFAVAVLVVGGVLCGVSIKRMATRN